VDRFLAELDKQKVKIVPQSLEDTNPLTKIDFSKCKISAPQLAQLKHVLRKHEGAFSKHAFDIGKATCMKSKIQLIEGNQPIKSKPYRTPFAYRKEVERQLRELEKYDIISKDISSPFASPLHVVP